MDRYSIALGKKPPPPLVIPESVKIYYMGATIEGKHWAAAICREKVDATIEIVDTTTMEKYSCADEVVKELNVLNKRYPIRLGLIDSLLLSSSKPLNFPLSCKKINGDLKNEINEFYQFWMNIPGVSKLNDGEGYKNPLENAIKLSFWALHESLTEKTPDLYTNKKSFNKHIKELCHLSGIKTPSRNNEIEFPEVYEVADAAFMARLEGIDNSLQNVERQIESL